MTPDEAAATIRRADHRADYALSRWIVLSIASTAAIGAVIFLAWPSILATSSIGSVLPAWLRVSWDILYGAGGGLIVAAAFLGARHDLAVRLEATGSCFLASSWLVYSIVIFINRGWRPGAVAASIFLGLFIGFSGRAWLLVHERTPPWMQRRS